MAGALGVSPATTAPHPAVRNPGLGQEPDRCFYPARLEREGLSPSPEEARPRPHPPRDSSTSPDCRRPWRRSMPLRTTTRRMPTTGSSTACSLRRASASGWRSRWLNAARYADTSGYQTDGDREMWRWRDWVIDAYNRNLPFDHFTIEQIAGDLLPRATLDQKIATGLQPQPPRQRRRRDHPRGVRGRVRRRSRRDHRRRSGLA